MQMNQTDYPTNPTTTASDGHYITNTSGSNLTIGPAQASADGNTYTQEFVNAGDFTIVIGAGRLTIEDYMQFQLADLVPTKANSLFAMWQQYKINSVEMCWIPKAATLNTSTPAVFDSRAVLSIAPWSRDHASTSGNDPRALPGCVTRFINFYGSSTSPFDAQWTPQQWHSQFHVRTSTLAYQLEEGGTTNPGSIWNEGFVSIYRDSNVIDNSYGEPLPSNPPTEMKSSHP
jgi:hypothetical protein